MLKNASLKFILICILALYASFGSAKANKDSNKVIIDSIARKQIGYLIHGEMEDYFSLISQNYTDLGGGPQRDGTVNYFEWKKLASGFAESKEFQNIKGKPVSTFLDTTKPEILNYAEILKVKGDISKFNFKLTEGDYWIYYPAKKGSFLSDGWFAIFRKENEKWKIIAGD